MKKPNIVFTIYIWKVFYWSPELEHRTRNDATTSYRLEVMFTAQQD